MSYYYPCKPISLAPSSSFFAQLCADKQWIAEVKMDGWRCLVERNGGTRLWTRHATRIDKPALEPIVTFASDLPDRTIVDGELVHFRTKTKQLYYAFDVLQLEGRYLFDLPLMERRRILLSLTGGTATGLPHIRIAQWHTHDKLSLFESTKTQSDQEGIVLKRTDSLYPASARRCLDNSLWLKVKHRNL